MEDVYFSRYRNIKINRVLINANSTHTNYGLCTFAELSVNCLRTSVRTHLKETKGKSKAKGSRSAFGRAVRKDKARGRWPTCSFGTL